LLLVTFNWHTYTVLIMIMHACVRLDPLVSHSFGLGSLMMTRKHMDIVCFTS